MAKYYTCCENTTCSQYGLAKDVEFREFNHVVYKSSLSCAVCSFTLQLFTFPPAEPNEDKRLGVPVDLREDGVLWLINRVVFHPRGFALGLNPDGSFCLLGDGTEVWTMPEKAEDECFNLIENLLARARGHNVGT